MGADGGQSGGISPRSSRFGYGGFMRWTARCRSASPARSPPTITSTPTSPPALSCRGGALGFEAALTDRGWPAPDGSVAVTVTRPDGVVHTVDLFDDGAHGDGETGDAVWGANYVQTAPQGVYKLLFRLDRAQRAGRARYRDVRIGSGKVDRAWEVPARFPTSRRLRYTAALSAKATGPLKRALGRRGRGSTTPWSRRWRGRSGGGRCWTPACTRRSRIWRGRRASRRRT